MKKAVEMIVEYTTDGTDYQYHDNHGLLIRCENCKHHIGFMEQCNYNMGIWRDRDFCSKGEWKDA